MAIFNLTASVSIFNTSGSDVYTVASADLTDPELVEIHESSGTDTLRLYDVGGVRDAGSFEYDGDALYYSTYDGGDIVIYDDALGADVSSIEYVQWQSYPDTSGYTKTLTLVTDLTDISGTEILVAGSPGDDIITMPDHGNQLNGWGEVYGGGGDDTIFLSATQLYFAYGGDGNDTFHASGNMGASAVGDAGNDVFYGADGNDFFSGDAGDDTFYSSPGDDIFSGGDGSDEFNFMLVDRDGIDTVTDFENGVDLINIGIDLSGPQGERLFDRLVSVTDTEDGALVSVANDEVLLLTDVTADQISASDFV